LNNNIFQQKTNNAIFLATVLVLGTISTILPSAQAQQYSGMDNDRKSDKKSVSVSSLKCNNINVDVNGLELSVLPPFLSGEVADTAADGETNANSFANNGANGGSEINDFRFICINNNNNTVIEAEEEPILPTPPEPEPLTCEECLLDALGPADLTRFETYLAGLDSTGANSLEEFCIFVGAQIAIGAITPDTLGEGINLTLIQAGITPLDDAELDALVACLFESTDENGNETAPCEECLLDALGPADLTRFETYLAGLDSTGFNSLEEFCIDVGAQIAIGAITPDTLGEVINQLLLDAGITPLDDAELDALVACLFELFGGTDNNAGGLAASNTNTDTSAFNIKTSGSLTASSFSSQPTIAQGTEDSPELTAMEKITS
jgi:hypothetical protein